MKKIDKKAILEALKEAGRLAFIAGLSFLITQGLKYFANVPETQTTIILTFILKSLNTWVHEQNIKLYKSVGIKDAGLSPV